MNLSFVRFSVSVFATCLTIHPKGDWEVSVIDAKLMESVPCLCLLLVLPCGQSPPAAGGHSLADWFLSTVFSGTAVPSDPCPSPPARSPGAPAFAVRSLSSSAVHNRTQSNLCFNQVAVIAVWEAAGGPWGWGST